MREEERGSLRREDWGQERVPLRLEEPGPEQGLLLRHERGQERVPRRGPQRRLLRVEERGQHRGPQLPPRTGGSSIRGGQCRIQSPESRIQSCGTSGEIMT